jgi:hypothetical protein
MSSSEFDDGGGGGPSIREFIGRYIRVAGIQNWESPRAWVTRPTTIRFRPDLLFVAILTGLVGAIATGAVSTIQAIGDGLVLVFEAAETNVARYIDLLFSATPFLNEAFAAAEADVLQFDVAGFAVALVVVMATYYLVSRGVELLE